MHLLRRIDIHGSINFSVINPLLHRLRFVDAQNQRAIPALSLVKIIGAECHVIVVADNRLRLPQLLLGQRAQLLGCALPRPIRRQAGKLIHRQVFSCLRQKRIGAPNRVVMRLLTLDENIVQRSVLIFVYVLTVPRLSQHGRLQRARRLSVRADIPDFISDLQIHLVRLSVEQNHGNVSAARLIQAVRCGIRLDQIQHQNITILLEQILNLLLLHIIIAVGVQHFISNRQIGGHLCFQRLFQFLRHTFHERIVQVIHADADFIHALLLLHRKFPYPQAEKQDTR